MLKFSWEWDIITRGATTRKICAFEDILKQLFLKNSRLYLRGCETNHTVDKKLYTKNNFLKKIIEFIPPCLVFPPPPQISHIIFLNNSHLPSPSRYGQRADKKGIALGWHMPPNPNKTDARTSGTTWFAEGPCLPTVAAAR